MILINYQSNGISIILVMEIWDLTKMGISLQLDILKMEKNFLMIMV